MDKAEHAPRVLSTRPAALDTLLLAHLLPLLKFLHEPQFGLQPTMWQPVVQRPLEAGREEGARSLVKCLSRLMIHAQKADLESIPPCR